MKESHINSIKIPTNILFNLIFIIFCSTCIIPFIIIASASFSAESDLIVYGYRFLPKKFSTEAWRYLGVNMMDLMRAYGVTIITTTVGTTIHVLIVCLCAYPLSRENFRFKRAITNFFVLTMFFNAGFVSFYLLCTQYLHLKNTLWALILPGLIDFGTIIIMRTFMKTSIPSALVESAHIDGAGDLTIFYKIIMPLSLPGIATIALFKAVGLWNDWTNALYFITDNRLSNLQYYLQRIMASATALSSNAEMAQAAAGMTDVLPTENVRMAICLVAIGPIILLYPFLQKYFIKGLMIGAIKG